jgi:hypothetical protein
VLPRVYRKVKNPAKPATIQLATFPVLKAPVQTGRGPSFSTDRLTVKTTPFF